MVNLPRRRSFGSSRNPRYKDAWQRTWGEWEVMSWPVRLLCNYPSWTPTKCTNWRTKLCGDDRGSLSLQLSQIWHLQLPTLFHYLVKCIAFQITTEKLICGILKQWRENGKKRLICYTVQATVSVHPWDVRKNSGCNWSWIGSRRTLRSHETLSGCLSNDDGDVNENRIKLSNRFRLEKQQLCTCITLFCTFLCRHCTTTTWKCLISPFVEDVNTRQRLSSSFSELRCSLLEFNSRKNCQDLTNWTR